jgi:membrane peptidoglycan carboxypeptidase
VARRTKIFLFYIPLCILLAAPVSAVLLYYFLVVSYDGKDLTEEWIQNRLASECLILDSDRNPIGSIFATEHRRYVPYEEIPETMVKSVVASEDSKFWRHHGVDFFALLRALYVNIRRGRIVQGGSTITMQTAENLFFRKRVITPGAKLKELIWTFRLERAFPKEKIIEFYLNQFFVTGTGRGIGIAAEYYFDKEPEALSWLECAYITGVLQGPGLYNPFIAHGEDAERVIERIVSRLSYVVRRLDQEGYITAEEAKELRWKIERFDGERFFRKGRIYFENLCLVNSAQQEMEGETITSSLMDRGIIDYSQAGVTIVTSIDSDIQRNALSRLREQVSFLKTALEGYAPPPGDAVLKKIEKNPATGTLYRATFVEKQGNEFVFAHGDDRGYVDPSGRATLERALKLYCNSLGSEENADSNLERHLEEKGTALLEFRETVHDKQYYNLLRWPGEDAGTHLDGGVLLLRNNAIVAMIGGFFDRDFNRATMAQRQFGSVFKPILFASAFELGWRPDDELPNERCLFQFQDTFYFPKPDHTPLSTKVSIMWAGVLSENLASVWLLYNLTSRLTPVEFWKLASWVGLARKDDESYNTYRKRIRDHILTGEDDSIRRGIVVGRELLKETAFEKAKDEIVMELAFENAPLSTIHALKKLHHGRKFDEYMKNEEIEYDMSVDLPKKTPAGGDTGPGDLFFVDTESISGDSLAAFLMRPNYLRLKELKTEWRRNLSSTENDQGQHRVNVYVDQMGNPVITDLPESSWKPYSGDIEALTSPVPDRGVDILVDGFLPLHVLDKLDRVIEHELRKFDEMKPYSEEVLAEVKDFRILVGLLYVTKMAALMGIETDIEPALSFPLGPTAVSLPEITSVYSALTTGFIHEKPPSLIDTIEDRGGETIFERRKGRGARLLAESTVQSIRQLLYHVVSQGTGRQANSIHMTTAIDDRPVEIPFPVMGKTGTSNNYRNSSFLGVIPYLEEGGLVEETEGFVLGVYVGYDLNDPMRQKGGNLRISGARGALPLWIDVVESIISFEGYENKLDRISLRIDPRSSLLFPEYSSTVVTGIDSRSGLPDETGDIRVLLPAHSHFRLPDITPDRVHGTR